MAAKKKPKPKPKPKGWPKNMSAEDIAGHERWTAIAVALGYNELAKTAKVLGEKVYFRLLRDKAADRIVELGGKAGLFSKDGTILEIETPDAMPSLKFRKEDIEIMREVVAAHDARKGAAR
jgi:hypothetical protein